MLHNLHTTHSFRVAEYARVFDADRM